MIAELRPLTEITQDAICILFREIGVVNTVRFLNQYTTGYGNYTEERRELFADQTLDELIDEIKQRRVTRVSHPFTTPDTTDTTQG